MGLDGDSSLCTTDSDTVGLTESRTRVLTNGLDLEVIYSNTNSRGLVILIILIESYHTTQSTILCPIISWHSHFPGLLKK